MPREVTSPNGRKSDVSLANRRDPPSSEPRLALSIPQFCAAFGISADFFYKLKRQGQGPRLMKVGKRTLISVAAADAWRIEREAATAASADA
jgi:predicted DNA-binding transcriptional regulator AlpA